MGSDPQLLSARLSAFLRRRTSAKALARSIGCDPRTAENMISGHWPGARHWLGLTNAFGHDVIEAVFHPQDALERLQLEERRLERQLAETRAKSAEVASLAPSGARVLAPVAARVKGPRARP